LSFLSAGRWTVLQGKQVGVVKYKMPGIPGR
jgi:hypothetical protein